MKMAKNIGQLIFERLGESDMTVTEFAKQVGMNRTSIYDVFQRPSIDTELLEKIGQVLEYDFFMHFLQEGTVDRIKMTHNIKKSKVVVEIELTDNEIEKLQLEDLVMEKVFYLKDENNNNNVAEPKAEYEAESGKEDFVPGQKRDKGEGKEVKG